MQTFETPALICSTLNLSDARIGEVRLVQKVTGHKTTDIVLKHYFQPGREDFRQALHDAMPRLLTNGQKTARDKMLDLITQVKQKALREQMTALLPKV